MLKKPILFIGIAAMIAAAGCSDDSGGTPDGGGSGTDSGGGGADLSTGGDSGGGSDTGTSPDSSTGPIAGFGAVCNQSKPCNTGLTCLVKSQGQSGFCSKKCTNKGKQCTGGPTGTFPACVLPLQGGGNACVFICKSGKSTFKCPSGLTCGTTANPPGSTQFVCEVPGTGTDGGGTTTDAGSGSGG